MGYTGTTNYGFQKPTKENAFTVDDLNNALDKIDETIKDTDDKITEQDTRLTSVESKNTQQDTAIAGKVNISQGVDNSGKVLAVGSDGNVKPQEFTSADKWDVIYDASSSDSGLNFGLPNGIESGFTLSSTTLDWDRIKQYKKLKFYIDRYDTEASGNTLKYCMVDIGSFTMLNDAVDKLSLSKYTHSAIRTGSTSSPGGYAYLYITIATTGMYIQSEEASQGYSSSPRYGVGVISIKLHRMNVASKSGATASITPTTKPTTLNIESRFIEDFDEGGDMWTAAGFVISKIEGVLA